MVYKGKFRIIDNLISACDYEFVYSEIEKAIKSKKKLLISPIASQTLVKAFNDKKLKGVLDKFDYLLPDSQWVRWSIGFLYGKSQSLGDRVYGPELMLSVCRLSVKKKYKIYLYGNTNEVLSKLRDRLRKKYPKLKIVGQDESKFRELTQKEWKNLEKKIIRIKPDIIFISLGSPKQEIFGYRLSKLVNRLLIIIPVGAAFNLISRILPQAPSWMQKSGLEWFFRLLNEPKRLWKRYLFFGPLFIFFIVRQKYFSMNYIWKKKKP